MLYSISKIIVKKKIVLGQSFLWTKPQQLYITLNVMALSQDVRVRQCDSNHTDISPKWESWVPRGWPKIPRSPSWGQLLY